MTIYIAIKLLLLSLSYKQYCGFLLIFPISYARFFYIKTINDPSFELYKLVIVTLSYLLATHIVQNVINNIMNSHLQKNHNIIRKLIFNFAGKLTFEQKNNLIYMYENLDKFNSFGLFIVLVWTHGIPFIIIILMKSIIEIIIITLLTIFFIYILKKSIINDQKEIVQNPFELPITISCGAYNNKEKKKLNLFQKHLSKILMCLYTIIIVIVIAIISNDRIIIQNFLRVSWMILVISEKMHDIKHYKIIIDYFEIKKNALSEYRNIQTGLRE
jgi:hypothetical protein